MVPFNDTNAGKDRPVVVLGWTGFGPQDDHNILLVPVTTFGGDPTGKVRSGDVKVSNYKDCGLKDNAYVRAHRLVSLNPRALRLEDGPRGTLTSTDFSHVLLEIEKLFAVPAFTTVPRSQGMPRR